MLTHATTRFCAMLLRYKRMSEPCRSTYPTLVPVFHTKPLHTPTLSAQPTATHLALHREYIFCNATILPPPFYPNALATLTSTNTPFATPTLTKPLSTIHQLPKSTTAN